MCSSVYSVKDLQKLAFCSNAKPRDLTTEKVRLGHEEEGPGALEGNQGLKKYR